MDPPLLQRIYELVDPARHIVGAQLGRLQQLQARLHGCPEVTPAHLARTVAHAVAGGNGAARVREVSAGVRDVLFALEIAADHVTSCIKDSRDHAAYDAALLPDLSGCTDDQVHEFLVNLQNPVPPLADMAALFRLILFSFTSLRSLLDYRLARAHSLLRRAGVHPRQPGVVEMARADLALAVVLATRVSDVMVSVCEYCLIEIAFDALNY